MKAENARQVQGLIELEKFNPETLCSGESWMAPSASEVSVVRALIPLTDIQLANRLDVDERTIRKWKSGETRMVFIDRNLNPQKTKKAPQNGCFFNTPCAPYERKRLLNRMTLIDTGYEWRFFAPFPVKWTQLPLCGSQPHTCCRASRSCIRTSSASR